jgi:hypothetical protein
VGFRLNPPPGWPPVPDGFVPPPGWQPDPSWPPPPPGWQLWLPDDTPGTPGAGGYQPGGYQPGGYQPGGYQPGDYLRPAKSGTNGFAIASLILGILGLFTISAILSIIFGIVALVKIRNVPQKGKGFAIAGLILSCVWLAALAILIAVSVATTAQRSTSGQVSHRGSMNIFALRFADCFDNPDAQSVTSVTAIPCTQPHNAQVFAQFNLTGSGYPGDAALRRQATDGCNARVAGNIDRSKITNTMNIRFIFPLPGSWQLGHRTVSCLIVDQTPDLTSSLLVAHPRG